MSDDGRSLPAIGGERASPVIASPVGRDLVRCGAELVELSERFYRGIFVGGLCFVGMASVAALAFLPLRHSDASYTTATVVATAVLAIAAPLAVRRGGELYRLLRRHTAAQLALVLLATALVVYPLHSELWWPSCALVMLVATLVPLRVALAYCLVVVLANLIAHLVWGDLSNTPPENIIGLWIGYVCWASAFAMFPERFAAYVIRLNTASPRPDLPPRQVEVDAPVPSSATKSADPPETVVARMEVVPEPGIAGDSATRALTARQLQVVALLADGLRYDEVGACLDISERQVQRHVSDAINRLGLRNSNELVAIAVAKGLVPRR